MKKGIFILAMGALLVSSCGTYTGSGAYAGSSIGAILGSAIGGISHGGRGADIGTIVGMAGGAAVGAAIGSQADKKSEKEVKDHYRQVQENKARGYNPYAAATGTQQQDEIIETQQVNGSAGYEIEDSAVQAPTTVPEYRLDDLIPQITPEPVIDETNSGDDRIDF